MAFEVRVNREKCKGCEECLEVCTTQVFEMNGNKVIPVRVSECSGCETCVDVCKEKAISVVNLEMGLSEIALSLLKNISSD